MRRRRLPMWVLVGALLLAARPVAAREPERPADAEALFSTGLEALLDGWPGLGRLHGPVRSGLRSWIAPDGVLLRLEARTNEAWLDGLFLGTMSLDVTWPQAGGPAELAVSIQGPAGTVEIRGTMPVDLDGTTGRLVWNPGPIQGRVEVRRVDLARWTAAFPGLALWGEVDVVLDLAGDPAAPSLQFQADGRDVRWRGQTVGAVQLAWSQEGEDAALSFRSGAPEDPSVVGTARIPMRVDLRAGGLDWLDAKPMELAVRAMGLTADRMRPLWSAPGGADFRLDVTLEGRGSLDNLEMTGNAVGEYLTAGGNTPLVARLAVGPAVQSLRLALGEALAVLDLSMEVPLVDVRRRGIVPVAAALRGNLSLDLPLPLAAPFLSILHQPEGRVAGAVAVSGTLGAPHLDGLFETREAHATFLALNRRVRDLAGRVVFAGNRIELAGLTATSARGTLQGEGALTLVATPPGHEGPLWSAWRAEGAASVTVAGFPVVQPGIPVARADGTIRANLVAGPGSFDAKIALHGGLLQLTGEKLVDVTPIPSDPGVRVRSLDRPGPAVHSPLAGGGHLGLDLALIDPVTVRGQGLDLSVGGRLVLDRRGPVVRVDGGFEVLPGGRFRLFDNRFDIRAGRMTLAEGRLDRPETAGSQAEVLADPDRPPQVRPLDPVVDLVARAKVVETHVLVKLQGRASRPELVLVSVPSLPPYQVLTLLIVGRVDVVDDRGGRVRREAARLVDRFHNPGLKRQLFDSVGVDNLGLGFGSNVSQPIVTVGKQITRQLYVETVYHHNAPQGQNRMQGNVQYRLTPSWKLDTVFGDAGEGGIGAFWATRFGGPPPPPAPDDDWGVSVPQPRGDADGDELEDPFDLCPDEPEDPDGFQDDDGCPDLDNDGDGIPDAQDADRMGPETFNGFQDDDGAPDVAPPRLCEVQGRFGTVAFPVGRARLDAQGMAVARAAAAVLGRLPGLGVRVVGHSDDSGTQSLNLVVSRARAQAVRDVMVRAGVPRRRILVEAVGADRPLDDSGTPEARDRNRRVELIFQ